MRELLRSAATIVAFVFGLVGLTLILYVWQLPPFTSSIQTTDNAYVRGQVTVVSPQLGGYVADVAVQDYEVVKAGQLLVKIDDRIYLEKLEQAKAALAAQQAALANSEQQRLSNEAKVRLAEAQVKKAEAVLKAAEANWERIEPLVAKGISTQKEADQAKSALDEARAGLAQVQASLEVARQDLAATLVGRQSLEAGVHGAEAAVRLAEIDLQNTEVRAPQNGRLGEVGARVGQYVSAGTQLMALVPETIWVVANFKETQLAHMQVGQPVTFTVDALEHGELTGRIERFAPAASSEFSVLKTDNATGNFTKVAQRVPVRIAIDPGQEIASHLVPGMSVVVTVDTSVPGAEAHAGAKVQTSGS